MNVLLTMFQYGAIKGKIMRLKKSDTNKTSRVTFRCKESEENKLQQKANIYTDGNISEYILYAALNFVPSKEDFEEGEEPKPRRKGKKKT